MGKRLGWLILLLTLGALVGSTRLPRAVVAQEATRIPVFPTLTARAPLQTRTPAPTSTTAPTNTPQPLPTLDATSALFLPLIGGEGSIFPSPTPGRIVQSVAGLVGTLERNPAGGERLRLSVGSLFALVPATTALDARLSSLAARAPLEVRVTGTLYTTGARDSNAFVVVTGIVENDEEEAATFTPTVARTLAPSATPTAGRAPTAIGRFDLVNLRAGPDNEYARSGDIRAGQRCPIVGRNEEASWIRLECAASAGWIEPRFVLVEGALSLASVLEVAAPTATATRTPTPTLTPTPFAFAGWRTLYFSNTSMAGVPVAVDDLPTLDLNWGTGLPRAGVPADAFSIRFERVVNFPSAFYIFTADADDGIRIYMDGQLVLDQFGGASGQVYRFGRELSGQHALRVEYVEFSGSARVRFGWAAAPAARWAATYTNLPQVAGGVVQRMEPESGQYPLDYNWGDGSPTGAPASNWTARWEGRFNFAPGNYYFSAQADDGVRLWIDGILVLDKWTDGLGEIRNRFIGIGAGDHTIRVEYFQRGGTARVRVWWIREVPGAPIPQ